MTMLAKGEIRPNASGLICRIALLIAVLSVCLNAAVPKPRFFFDNSAGPFSKKTPITIDCPTDDITSTKEELQILLQQSGFKVFSARAGKLTTTVSGNQDKTVEQGTEYTTINDLEQSQREKSQESQAYVQQLDVKYATSTMIAVRYRMVHNNAGGVYTDRQGKMYYASFTAELASRETGEIMMSMQYPYNADGYEKTMLLKDMVKRMSLCAEKGSCDEASQSQEPTLSALADSKGAANGGKSSGGGVILVILLIFAGALVFASVK